MSTWKTFPTNEPTDQEYVWIRLNYYSGIAFLAQWDKASQSFTSVENDITYPAWTVVKWESINPDLIYGIGGMYIGINFLVS
jgi:hypothetical protein